MENIQEDRKEKEKDRKFLFEMYSKRMSSFFDSLIKNINGKSVNSAILKDPNLIKYLFDNRVEFLDSGYEVNSLKEVYRESYTNFPFKGEFKTIFLDQSLPYIKDFKSQEDLKNFLQQNNNAEKYPFIIFENKFCFFCEKIFVPNLSNNTDYDFKHVDFDEQEISDEYIIDSYMGDANWQTNADRKNILISHLSVTEKFDQEKEEFLSSHTLEKIKYQAHRGFVFFI